MNQDSRNRILSFLSVIWLVGCQSSNEAGEIGARFTSDISMIRSRDVEVPVTLVMPQARPGQLFPLVVMAHGHGGDREEAGGFTRVAAGLAGLGVASIRMDFPGCGDSREPFTNNHLSNMLADISSSLEYALAQPHIDPDKVAILGYSMGGRLALLASVSHDYRAIVTWAPAGTDGASSMFPFFGGQSAYAGLRSDALMNGRARFTTPWGQEQLLGSSWFTEMEDSRPLAAIESFEGPLLVLHGRNDEVIPAAVGAAVVDAATNSSEARLHFIENAGHGLGFYDDEPAPASEVVEATLQFLAKHLLQ